MSLQLSDDDKLEMQDVTGQLPILLSSLCRINLGGSGGGETPGGRETPEADIYACKLTQLYDGLWNCAEVKSMVSAIFLFAREKTDKLWDSPKLLRYLNRYSSVSIV